MNKINLGNYSLYETSYSSEIPVVQYYTILFNHLPSVFECHSYYNSDISSYFKENNFKLETHLTFNGFKNGSKSMFVNKEKGLIVTIENRPYFDTDVKQNKVIVLYNVELGQIEEQFDFNNIEKYKTVKKKSNINLIKSECGSLDCEAFNLKIPKMDIRLNYGESFLKIHNLIESRLNKDKDSGIILLHGDSGSGKSTYIKYLTSLIKEKEVLFIPPSIAEVLSEPSIIPFLMEHKNSVLIIEDAERVIADREFNGSSVGVSNILNLTDGILGDCLNIQIIATFNMKKERIDQALLRKGRLIAEHKFEKLTIEQSNSLLKSLNKQIEVDSPMTLADIYNIENEYYRSINTTQKIGFLN